MGGLGNSLVWRTHTMNDQTAAHGDGGDAQGMTLTQFQKLIADMYLPKDRARGIDGTFMWLMEEVGELAAALRHGTSQQRAEEFADVLAWLATIANVAEVDLGRAVMDKYGRGCPGCGGFRCTCDDAGKP